MQHLRFFQSCAVVGLEKIGKTSLVKKALEILRETEEEAFDTIFFSLNETTPSESWFYHDLLDIISEEASGLSREDLPPNRDETTFRDLKRALEKRVRRGGNHLFIVLEDFDRSLSYQDPTNFTARLRSLFDIARDDLKIAFVLVSRRTLPMIEEESGNSLIGMACRSFVVKPFDRDDFESLCARYPYAPLPEDFKDELFDYTGGHPYLASVILRESYESFCSHTAFHEKDKEPYDLAGLLRVPDLRNDLSRYIGEIKRFLERIPERDEAFARQGVRDWYHWLIWNQIYGAETPERITTAFSDYGFFGQDGLPLSSLLRNYLENDLRFRPVWGELSTIERGLRKDIDAALRRFYGTPDWFFTRLNEEECDWEQHFIRKVRRFQEKDIVGEQNSPMNYLYFDDLLGLILIANHWSPDPESPAWCGFQRFFDGTQGREKLEGWMRTLGETRNCEAHHREYPDELRTRFAIAYESLRRALQDLDRYLTEDAR